MPLMLKVASLRGFMRSRDGLVRAALGIVAREALAVGHVERTACDQGAAGTGRVEVDLLAGTVYAPVTMPARAPTILVFDSGLGGLTVLAESAG